MRVAILLMQVGFAIPKKMAFNYVRKKSDQRIELKPSFSLEKKLISLIRPYWNTIYCISFDNNNKMCYVIRVILAALLVGSWSFTLQVKVAHERSMSTFALNTERVETDNVSLAGCSLSSIALHKTVTGLVKGYPRTVVELYFRGRGAGRANNLTANPKTLL